MAAAPTSAAEVLAHYCAGFFPLYDLDNQFYWERLPLRAVIPLAAETVSRARKLRRRSGNKFTLRHSTDFEQVIYWLQHPRVKTNTWVRREVVDLYQHLMNAGLLQTIEAYDTNTGQLAGALLGLVLPGTFIAETMFALQPDASKICLCELIENAFAAGHKMLDVQTPHDAENLHLLLGHELPPAGKTSHPCVRLGEQTLPIALFMQHFKAAAAAFRGTQADWLKISTALAATRRSRAAAADALRLDPRQLAVAGPMLQHNFPQPREGA